MRRNASGFDAAFAVWSCVSFVPRFLTDDFIQAGNVVDGFEGHEVLGVLHHPELLGVDLRASDVRVGTQKDMLQLTLLLVPLQRAQKRKRRQKKAEDDGEDETSSRKDNTRDSWRRRLLRKTKKKKTWRERGVKGGGVKKKEPQEVAMDAGRVSGLATSGLGIREEEWRKLSPWRRRRKKKKKTTK